MYCEDYPCCGHTDQDPCDGHGPTSDDMLRDPAAFHLGCDHEAGFCEYEDDMSDDEDDTADCPFHGKQTVIDGGNIPGFESGYGSWCQLACGCCQYDDSGVS